MRWHRREFRRKSRCGGLIFIDENWGTGKNNKKGSGGTEQSVGDVVG